MTQRRRFFLLATTAVVVATWAAVPVGAAGSVTHGNDPAAGKAKETFNAIDAIAPDDVWEVGVRSRDTPLVRHWDGTQWQTFTGPKKLQGLYAVTHTSDTSVWAGGTNGIMHWDGSAWSLSYNAPGAFTFITGLAAISADDVWGVGWKFGAEDTSVAVHWDGSTWSQIGAPEDETALGAVDADSPDDVWAVGLYGVRPTHGVVEHWDGASWKHVADGLGYLFAVAAVSPDDVWVAGGHSQAQMWHWDGHDLQPVDVPTPGRRSSLTDLSVVSATDIWAAGFTSRAGGPTHTLIEHWDGRHWHIRPTPDSPYDTFLNGVSADSADDAYAVGVVRETRFHHEPLTLHWDGTAWTQMP